MLAGRGEMLRARVRFLADALNLLSTPKLLKLQSTMAGAPRWLVEDAARSTFDFSRTASAVAAKLLMRAVFPSGGLPSKPSAATRRIEERRSADPALRGGPGGDCWAGVGCTLTSLIAMAGDRVQLRGCRVPIKDFGWLLHSRDDARSQSSRAKRRWRGLGEVGHQIIGLK
jgi:hypothetical protein